MSFPIRLGPGVALAAVSFALVLVGGAQAADPLAGSWIGVGGQLRDRAHTIKESGGTLTITAAETYTLPEVSSCTVAAGTVLGVFHVVGTIGTTERRYEGTFFGWDTSNGTCTITPAAGQWTAALTAGGDPFQKPPLADGPNNKLGIYPGSYGTKAIVDTSNGYGFTRKGGTAAAGATATSPTSAAAAGLSDYAGTWTATVESGLKLKGRVIAIARSGSTLRVTAAASWAGKGCTVQKGRLLWSWRSLGGNEFKRYGWSATGSCTPGEAYAGQQTLYLDAAKRNIVATCINFTSRCDTYARKSG